MKRLNMQGHVLDYCTAHPVKSNSIMVVIIMTVAIVSILDTIIVDRRYMHHGYM